jgi:hypothetical protein
MGVERGILFGLVIRIINRWGIQLEGVVAAAVVAAAAAAAAAAAPAVAPRHRIHALLQRCELLRLRRQQKRLLLLPLLDTTDLG